VFRSCIKFPLRRTLEGVIGASNSGDDVEHQDEGLYDPAFVLPLFKVVLEEKLSGLEWVEVLRCNVLGLGICALSSRDEGMRGLGGWCLAKTMEIISVSY
jgi:nucleolar pre-ribosomal-associated protein 1